MDQTELMRELRDLRRGRAVQAVSIANRLGPWLRKLCRVTDHDDDHETRRKLTRTLTSLATCLPPDLRTCFLAAYSLPPEEGLPFYVSRLEWAGTQVHREIRTVRRRVDQAIARVAQAAARRRVTGPDADAGWYTMDLDASVALTPEGLEVFEFRRIRTERDGVGEISVFWTTGASDVPLPIDELKVDVLRGGRLVSRDLVAANRIQLRVSFPAPLREGQGHDIVLRIRMPATRADAAHYVHVPFQRCDHFQLDFAFKVPPPDAVALLVGVLPGDADDQLVAQRPVAMTAQRDVHVDFTDLVPYLAYGIRWQRPHLRLATGQIEAVDRPSSRLPTNAARTDDGNRPRGRHA